jgi:tRNA G18 (ribose-2'-O)-methylase SpoU
MKPKLNSNQLRHGSAPNPEDIKSLKRHELYIILDNVLDTYNVGSIFRLADAVGARKVYLCGNTETPPNHRIKKASVNTWQWVEWEHATSAADAITYLRRIIPKITVVAVELTETSTPYDMEKYPFPLALVVGHETAGVSKKILSLVDRTVELPMLGINTSLNVMVSLGIVLYRALSAQKKK